MCSAVNPSGACTAPFESETLMTWASSIIAFSTAYCATLPEPDTDTRMPSKLIPRRASISCAK